MSTPMWQCNKCKHIHRGSSRPEKCPKCGASRAEFKPMGGGFM